MIKSFFIIITLIALKTKYVNGENILVLIGPVAQSHFIWCSRVMNELAIRGHNLTVLFSVYPSIPEPIHENIHQIFIKLPKHMTVESNQTKWSNKISVNVFNPLFDHLFSKYKTALETNAHKILLDYSPDFKFDLILYEYTAAFVYIPLIQHFGYPPVIALVVGVGPSLVTTHRYPAYIPHYNSEYDVNMSFFQRLCNTIIYVIESLAIKYILRSRLKEVTCSYYRNDNSHCDDSLKNISLFLVNSHPSINYAEYIPPNVIEVGGLHISDRKPLPDHIEEFINRSKKGTILLSFGTSIESTSIGLNRSQTISDAMRELKDYNFLWKSDFTQFDVKMPSNVLVGKFLPQRDILGHPKVKVFVTHTGLMSFQEAVWRGVPMVTIPYCLDQYRSAQLANVKGIAEKLDFETFSADTLKKTIQKVAEDPKYAQNVQTLSKLFKDQPKKPLDTAIWWIEYILRNPKSNHLRSPADDLGFIKANLIDVGLFLIALLFLIYIFLLKYIYYYFIKYFRILKDFCNYKSEEKKRKMK